MNSLLAPLKSLRKEKERLRSLKKDLAIINDVEHLEELRDELDKLNDEIGYDLYDIFKKENDIIEDFNHINELNNQNVIELDQNNFQLFIDDIEDEIEEIADIIERVENLAKKGKLSRLPSKRRVLKTLGDLLIASVVTISAYASPTIALGPVSLTTSLVLVVLGAFLIKQSKKINSKVFFESILLSFAICMGLSVFIGLVEGESAAIMFTIAFVTLPSVLIFDAIMK